MICSLTNAGGLHVGALIVLLMGTASAPVLADTGGEDVASARDPDETGWLNASVGISVGDALQLNSRIYRPGFDPVPTLSVGWSWRIDDFDLGLSIEHIPGAHSSTYEGQPTRLGDQVGVLASIRYRYSTMDWGGFYVTASPGLGVFMTTETLRGAVALAEGVTPQEVASHGLGLSFQSSSGFFTRLSETLQFFVEVGVYTTFGTLDIAGEGIDYERYRARFRAGLEWRL